MFSALTVASGEGVPAGQKPTKKRREAIQVEPLSSFLKKYKGVGSIVMRDDDTLYLSGLPPFDPKTGEISRLPIERQAEIVLDQMKLSLEAAGSSMKDVVKVTVYCTSPEKFGAVNDVYSRDFPDDPPARMFVVVPSFPAPFDIEMDCAALCGER